MILSPIYPSMGSALMSYLTSILNHLSFPPCNGHVISTTGLNKSRLLSSTYIDHMLKESLKRVDEYSSVTCDLFLFPFLSLVLNLFSYYHLLTKFIYSLFYCFLLVCLLKNVIWLFIVYIHTNMWSIWTLFFVFFFLTFICSTWYGLFYLIWLKHFK